MSISTIIITDLSFTLFRLSFYALPALLFAALYLLVLRVKNRKWALRKAFWLFLFLLYLLILADLTGLFFLPISEWSTDYILTPNFFPLVHANLAQLALNLLLMLPFGFLLPLVFPKTKWNFSKILLLGICVPLLIEMLQIFCRRSWDIDDVLMNLCGTLLGYGIFRLLHKITPAKH